MTASVELAAVGDAQRLRIRALGNPAKQVGRNTLRLSDVMRELAQRPRKLRQFGGGIIHAVDQGDTLSMSPLGAEPVEDDGPMLDGYLVKTRRASRYDRRTLLIVEAMRFGEDGSPGQTSPLHPDLIVDVRHTDHGDPLRVQVTSKTREAITTFVGPVVQCEWTCSPDPLHQDALGTIAFLLGELGVNY